MREFHVNNETNVCVYICTIGIIEKFSPLFDVQKQIQDVWTIEKKITFKRNK